MNPFVSSNVGSSTNGVEDHVPEAIGRAVASLPAEQMFELMRQVKRLIETNAVEAKNMLVQNPQLSYALLQAQTIMGVVDSTSVMYRLSQAKEDTAKPENGMAPAAVPEPQPVPKPVPKPVPLPVPPPSAIFTSRSHPSSVFPPTHPSSSLPPPPKDFSSTMPRMDMPPLPMGRIENRSAVFRGMAPGSMGPPLPLPGMPSNMTRPSAEFYERDPRVPSFNRDPGGWNGPRDARGLPLPPLPRDPRAIVNGPPTDFQGHDRMMRDPRETRNDQREMRGDPREMRVEPREMRVDPRQMSVDPREMRVDPREMRADPREMRADPREMRADPREMRADPREMRADPREMRADPREMRADPREMRLDQREIRGDPRDVRGDPREIRGDLREMRGDPREMRDDIPEMRGDPRELRGDPREMRGDPREVRGDLRDTRGDPRDRGDLRVIRGRDPRLLRDHPYQPEQTDSRIGGRSHAPLPIPPPVPMPIPSPGFSAPPSAPRTGPASNTSDTEKAALIMQVLQLSEEQIAMLPPEQRQSILILKSQIARSTNVPLR